MTFAAIILLASSALSVMEAVRVDQDATHYRMTLSTATPLEPDDVTPEVDAATGLLRVRVRGASIPKRTRIFITDDGYQVQADQLRDRARVVGTQLVARLPKGARCSAGAVRKLPDRPGVMIEVNCEAVAAPAIATPPVAAAEPAAAGHAAGNGHEAETGHADAEHKAAHEGPEAKHEAAKDHAAPASEKEAHGEPTKHHDKAESHADTEHEKPDSPPAEAEHAAEAASGTSWTSVLLPIILLAVLAGVAFVLARRRRAQASLIEVMETASLGPRRQLIVARFQNELLVLGSTDGGISLLAVRALSAGGEDGLAADTTSAGTTDGGAGYFSTNVDAALQGLASKMGTAAAVDAASGIDDSVEDRELRRKLAQGLGGRS